jgi:hypothetical protein
MRQGATGPSLCRGGCAALGPRHNSPSLHVMRYKGPSVLRDMCSPRAAAIRCTSSNVSGLLLLLLLGPPLLCWNDTCCGCCWPDVSRLATAGAQCCCGCCGCAAALHTVCSCCERC